MVDDDSFSWNNAKRCLEKVETLHPEIPSPKLKKYVNPTLKGIFSDFVLTNLLS